VKLANIPRPGLLAEKPLCAHRKPLVLVAGFGLGEVGIDPGEQVVRDGGNVGRSIPQRRDFQRERRQSR